MKYRVLREWWLRGAGGVAIAVLLASCNPTSVPTGPVPLNSRSHDEQPSLSGDGRFLAFVSSRDGRSQILLYDLRRRRFVPIPGVNRRNEIAESPSLSRTGRYLAYLVNRGGRLQVALYDRVTEESQLLTKSYRSWIRNPSISPDGRYVVFESGRRGQWDLELIDRGPEVEPDIADGTPIPPN